VSAPSTKIRVATNFTERCLAFIFAYGNRLVLGCRVGSCRGFVQLGTLKTSRPHYSLVAYLLRFVTRSMSLAVLGNIIPSLSSELVPPLGRRGGSAGSAGFALPGTCLGLVWSSAGACRSGRPSRFRVFLPLCFLSFLGRVVGVPLPVLRYSIYLPWSPSGKRWTVWGPSPMPGEALEPKLGGGSERRHFRV